MNKALIILAMTLLAQLAMSCPGKEEQADDLKFRKLQKMDKITNTHMRRRLQTSTNPWRPIKIYQDLDRLHQGYPERKAFNEKAFGAMTSWYEQAFYVRDDRSKIAAHFQLNKNNYQEKHNWRSDVDWSAYDLYVYGYA